MPPFRLYATTGDSVAQLDSPDGERVVADRNLEGRGSLGRSALSCDNAGSSSAAAFLETDHGRSPRRHRHLPVH